MKYTNFDAWTIACMEAGAEVRHTQGFEQYEARKGDAVLSVWNGECGELDDEPTPLPEPEIEPLTHTDPATGEEIP